MRVHLDNAYLMPYDSIGKGAVCTCSARASCFAAIDCFGAPTGQTAGIADAKLAGYMYTISTSVLLWLPFLWGGACARQHRRKLYSRWDPPVLGNFELSTPNLVN